MGSVMLRAEVRGSTLTNSLTLACIYSVHAIRKRATPCDIVYSRSPNITCLQRRFAVKSFFLRVNGRLTAHSIFYSVNFLPAGHGVCASAVLAVTRVRLTVRHKSVL